MEEAKSLPKALIDTQMISYEYKGAKVLHEKENFISSITASEFLNIYGTDYRTANYYPIVPSKVHANLFFTGKVPKEWESPKHERSEKRLSDQIIMDFRAEIPTIIEFGSFAITEIINRKSQELFEVAIRRIERRERKKLVDKFMFLIRHNIQCFALGPQNLSIAFGLLDRFLSMYKPKENIRNSVNDVLILSTAVWKGMDLLSKDKVLVKFAKQLFPEKSVSKDGYFEFKLSEIEPAKRRKSGESKGYINRGWQYQMKK